MEARGHDVREHEWKYGSEPPGEASYRVCGGCGMRQWTDDRGNWDDPEWVLWRMKDGGRWLEWAVPECPDPPPPEAEWSRAEDDERPRWEIRNPSGDGRNYLCTDEAIRKFGRRHMEKILAGLPPLPGRAWEVTGG